MSKVSLSDLKFITPTAFRAWFNGGAPGKFAVIDVRESDYIGGHIRGCLHYPAGNFNHKIPDLKKELIDRGINDVVFHCAMSQVRGPRSALRFMRSLEGADELDKDLQNLNIWVLRGGFSKWQEAYGEDPDVTEDYDKELWQFGS